MALSREMQDGARLVPVEQSVDKGLVADVPLLEAVGRMLLNRGEVLQVARIGKLVEVDYWRAHQREPIQNEVRSNEPGSAGDENGRQIVKHHSPPEHFTSTLPSWVRRSATFL